jgi:hypothetical protein
VKWKVEAPSTWPREGRVSEEPLEYVAEEVLIGGIRTGGVVVGVGLSGMTIGSKGTLLVSSLAELLAWLLERSVATAKR